ncbi:MAG: xanthine dehydrogenase family protein molybdopterin-binding subunit [Planctomycetaceae bacterium]|nr:xanthine dehydrogenase family protein molybdopterin-binding subunit [Planctomycetaceae bacterium]
MASTTPAGSTTVKHHDRQYKVIGTRPVRHDGADKVTGRAQYGADKQLPGLLAGYILRSPHAHANIRSIDTSAAEAYPGVYAVLTGKDMPHVGDRIAELGEGAVRLCHLSANCMAQGKALYHGHAVAAVAAESIHIAEEAARLIKIDYEVLPPVMDVLQAMESSAPVLNDDVFTEEMGQQTSSSPSNVAGRFLYELGDVDKGFAQADVVVEREFRTATVHQGYIEPHTTTALWHGDGRLTLWTSTQGSFTVRQQVAELLEVPLTWVKVVPMEIGGGFGGKISVYEQPVAALLSKKAGRPVKVTMDRADVFKATGPTPGSVIRVKLGMKKSGEIVAADAWLAYEAGGYPGSPINPGCMCILACYDIPNARVEGFDVCVNKPRTNAYRAPGSTNAAFALETVLEEACAQLGLNSLDVRIQNAVKEGSRRVDGYVYPRIGLIECLEAVKNSDHYQSKLDGPHRGRGVACGFWFNIGLKSSVTATVNTDGKVSLVEGSTDIGGTRTSISMQFAEVLGIPVEDVQPIVADTDSVGYTDVTGGSRVTMATGMAAYKTALAIRDLMCERAARIWECDVEQVRYNDDATLSGPDGKSITFQEVAAQIVQTGESITATGNTNMPNSSNAFGVHLVDVEVDPDTGKTTILRYTACQDAGTAIHPAYVEGQMHGGAVQGIGWALNEEYCYDKNGLLRNANFLDYRMPTSYDLPNIETIIVEVPNPDHPYGVRGVGEVPICPPPAAIGAAIHQASGVWMHELPMSPPRLLHEILAQR